MIKFIVINNSYKINMTRRGRDSNPRGAKPPADFESEPFDHSGTSPSSALLNILL